MLGIKKLKDALAILEAKCEVLKDAHLEQLKLNLFLLDAIEALSLKHLEASEPKVKKSKGRKK